jgi:glycosyltransferase involved in cell wall biosynthesis
MRLDHYFLSRFWHPRQVSKLAQEHEALFCTDVRQIPHFSGSIIVDTDDPVFTEDYINLLNHNNVVAVVTTTDLLKGKLVDNGLDKPCHVLPSGVHLSHLNISKVKTLEAKMGKRPSDIVVGFAIPYIYTENDKQTKSGEGELRSITYLSKVMEKVWQENPSIQLWLLGIPSQSVQNYAQAHHQVRLLGYVEHSEILNYYANFDIAVYPRTVDMGGRHSIKLVEFMASGVPIVSTPVSESFYIRQSGSGFIADSLDEFSSHILRLAADVQLRSSLGSMGQRYARQFGWDTLIARYESEVFGHYLPLIG